MVLYTFIGISNTSHIFKSKFQKEKSILKNLAFIIYFFYHSYKFGEVI